RRPRVDRVHHAQQNMRAAGNLGRGTHHREQRNQSQPVHVHILSNPSTVKSTRVAKDSFDKKLEALRASDDPDQIRKALKDRNNFLVSKAAALAASRGLVSLIPDLEAAFDRFFKDPVKSDPKCWA